VAPEVREEALLSACEDPIKNRAFIEANSLPAFIAPRVPSLAPGQPGFEEMCGYAADRRETFARICARVSRFALSSSYPACRFIQNSAVVLSRGS
jgi:hypothetical protein